MLMGIFTIINYRYRHIYIFDCEDRCWKHAVLEMIFKVADEKL